MGLGEWVAALALVLLVAWATDALFGRRLVLAFDRYLLAAGHLDLALWLLETAYARHAGDWVIGHRLAQMSYQLGRASRALAVLDELLPQAPAAVQGALLALRADCLDRMGRAAEAEQTRAAAAAAYRERDPGSLFARELEIDQLGDGGDWHTALHELEELVGAMAATPADPPDAAAYRTYLTTLRLRLARAYVDLGHHGAAIALLETILGRAGQPDSVRHSAHLTAARAYLALGNLDQAERDAQDAFRLANAARDPARLIDDCLALGEVCVRRGDFVGAMREYQRVRECGPDGRWLAWLAEAELLALWGRQGEAERAAQRARDLAPADGASAAVAALAQAAVLYDHDPAAARAVLWPTLAEPGPGPRWRAQRAALAAMVAAATGDEPAPWCDQLAQARRDFGHDPRLLATLDEAEAELAWLAGDFAAAGAQLEAALERPADPLAVPRLQVRLAACATRLGTDSQSWLQRAADGALPLAAAQEARRQLAATHG